MTIEDAYWHPLHATGELIAHATDWLEQTIDDSASSLSVDACYRLISRHYPGGLGAFVAEVELDIAQDADFARTFCR